MHQRQVYKAFDLTSPLETPNMKQQRKLRSKVRERLKRFGSLKSIDEQTKRSLLRSVRHHEIHLAAATNIIESARSIVNSGFVLVLYGVMIASGLIFWKLTIGVSNLSRVKFEFIVGVVVTSLFITIFPFILLQVIVRSRLVFRVLGLSKLAFSFMFLTVLIEAALISRLMPVIKTNQASEEQMLIAVGAVAGISFGVWSYAAAPFLIAIQRHLQFRKMKFYPDAVIVDNLLEVLSLIERRHSNWTDVTVKQQLIRKLEETATCMEKHLAELLRSRDRRTDTWIEDSAEQIATGIRELIKWVFSPKNDTVEQLTRTVTNYFVYAARGDWDSFDRIAIEKLSRPELLRTKLKSTGRALLLAAIPILVLSVVKRINLIQEPINSYLTVGAYIWAAITLLSQTDPSYSTKLTAIKDISQLVFPGRGEKS